MTYDDALAFWYGRINYEVRSAGPLDLKLERMRALLRRLGDPHDRVRVAHVTGTKGKGSTCAMLASVLRAAGYRVGLFTSPHLVHVEERMQVDGVPISRAELVARMEEVAPAVQAMESEGKFPGPTFFEIGTALGFLHFNRRRCDVAVIEVGLGGRFDSTNVCSPLVSVITNVGFDHMAQLGNTLEAIAFQKAGIIKPRVPVVSGVTQDGPRAVVRRAAAELRAPLWEQGGHLGWDRANGRVTVATPGGTYEGLALGLLGPHQAQNAAVAVAALDRLREAGFHLPAAAVARGLAEVRWPARIELVRERPVVVLDTAHNVPSAGALVNTLREEFPTAAARRVVFAVSADKQYADILKVLATYFTHFYLTKYANNPRRVPPERLAEVLRAAAPGAALGLYETAPDAWRAARAAASDADVVCVTGSVFLAGELGALVRA